MGYAGGIGGIISADSNSASSYYHYDGLGSVTDLTDASGATVHSYTYEAFGNILRQSGTVDNNYKFQTKQASSLTGLVHFGARYYNPLLGRWLTPDPLGMVDGPNLYTYLNNNPVNLVDPWGMCEEELGLQEDWLAELGLGYIAEGMLFGGLYSGGKAVLYFGPDAWKLAAASSGTPIFKTLVGGSMNWIESFGFKFPRIVWDIASAIYAATAKGPVQVFSTVSKYSADYSSTFARIEAPIIEFLGKAEMILK